MKEESEIQEIRFLFAISQTFFSDFEIYIYRLVEVGLSSINNAMF